MKPRLYSPDYCDSQYNPGRIGIPNMEAIVARWQDQSAEAMKTAKVAFDIPYGPAAGQRLDVFQPDQPSGSVFMFIHGGYWMFSDKADFAFLAPAFTRAGITFVNVNYSLAPNVSLEAIVEEIKAAIYWIYMNAHQYHIDGKALFCCGHSAGGHLATMMLCSEETRNLIRGVMSISGIHDLEPLRHAAFLDNVIKLDTGQVEALSPIAHETPAKGRLCLAVGADENAEFRYQTEALAKQWGAMKPEVIVADHCHHLSILDDLGRPGSAVHTAALTMMAQPSP